ncbi:MmgE/PrpD family protein [Bradyrhizobium sp. WSM 1704]|uniref:MmgE/PrpD family protein n=1 Tax=Bradyrhizobium semiaridum TaxID=2821404 RepID=UPI001CE2A2B0|nr:MmgE/PrpD family protein [Bradyrhizobium semiaridum]MCA6123172.1 MmgE/PrpD family protein [Bradyrhizobium semiaridum]
MNISAGMQQARAHLTESGRLAAFALGLRLEDVPADVLVLAKEHLLDAFGIALASTGFDFGKAILAGARELGEGAGATAIGSGVRLPAPSAALVNGVLAHGLDFDDTHIGAIYHATAPALAAVLAAGEANDASGEAVLLALVSALEIGCRLATVGAGAFHDRSFHPTSLCGTFAAAVAAGRLSGLDHQHLVWALGLCGSQAAGILEQGGSWLKRLHPGWAAHSALAAVAMAKAGFTGPATVFEGARGFYYSHIDRIPTGSELPSHALGAVWQSRGIALKPYPCCHFIHAFVDAALELRGRFALDDVERIECPLTPQLHKMVAEPRARCIYPSNPYEALFSVQYVVALALVRGRVDLAAFHDDPLDAPDITVIAEKTWCVDDPESDYPGHFPGEVIVYLKDGRKFGCRKPSSLGTIDVPLSREALLAKFAKNATRVISGAAADRIAEFVLDIEKRSSIRELLAIGRVGHES